MKRFYHDSSNQWTKLLASLLIFMICFSAFFAGLSGVSDESYEKQIETLSLALNRSIAHCYAFEGHYPESLDYLKNHYGISYDSDKFFVDYQVYGENIFPDISIVPLEP